MPRRAAPSGRCTGDAMLPGKISASLMCSDLTDVRQGLRDLERCGVEYLHVDVMDGVFVPNFMLSEAIVRQYRPLTSIPFDYHLMLVEPEQKLDWFDFRPGDLVSVHYESTPNVGRAVRALKDRGVRPGLALNPGTPPEAAEFLLPYLEFLLIMTVDPGFAGQPLFSGATDKIARARAFLDGRGRQDVMIEVDGNVSFEHAVEMRRAGADIFVAGTSSIYKAGLTVEEGALRLRQSIGG